MNCSRQNLGRYRLCCFNLRPVRKLALLCSDLRAGTRSDEQDATKKFKSLQSTSRDAKQSSGHQCITASKRTGWYGELENTRFAPPVLRSTPTENQPFSTGLLLSNLAVP